MERSEKLSNILLSEFSRVGFIRQSELIPNIIPFSAATLWRKVKSGEFPQPIKLSKGITAWRRKDVAQYLDNLSEQSMSA